MGTRSSVDMLSQAFFGGAHKVLVRAGRLTRHSHKLREVACPRMLNKIRCCIIVWNRQVIVSWRTETEDFLKSERVGLDSVVEAEIDSLVRPKMDSVVETEMDSCVETEIDFEWIFFVAECVDQKSIRNQFRNPSRNRFRNSFPNPFRNTFRKPLEIHFEIHLEYGDPIRPYRGPYRTL